MVVERSLLRLLQLASPALPVGAYSYSEGLEFLVHSGRILDQGSLQHWLVQELCYGAVRLEAVVMVRSYQARAGEDWEAVCAWNRWLSAVRETEELRLQSWQMGRSLLRLLVDLQPETAGRLPVGLREEGCNFAIAFGVVAADWQIDLQGAVLGYLHSWSTNLINAGIKLIPLGQTAGQQLLLALNPVLEQMAQEVLNIQDEDLSTCGWGLALASMAHETQYSRLFRS
ncbi:urease accessory protein UreF [Leptothermofonsia sp. ETS-13]|uniref:urease accessory protein UreF n=1 Tax=Leptothermofonsia sp. ETS-13 TaxID=3035696 RepID=UPI003BA31360